ncbi:M16 family metallopeptidase [Undibacterium flavidum]|uniref:Insulinase family protein n=1 Tax=Undibacterium flavidum TaxID=2762297 RepID=A0ABR6Y865_9BURK|nr:pitrilysin family protein [Undibacterium flavidum]MBC3872802.1 insulinase family protein [Undibacterium flavidum]
MKLKPIYVACALAFGSAALTIPSFAQDAKSSAAKMVKKPGAAPAASVYTSVEGITEYRLANGLRVLLAPDASKPTTTVNVTYLVGSRHESYGETGMAHLLEHLLFKGTKTSGNLMDQLSKRGMQFNGTTFYDRTNYYETFPASEDNLQWALSMEADRMINSKIARSDLDTEFSVVRNEMEIGENNPFRVLWKQLAAATFDWHNYGNNTIGARADVEGVKIENLQGFYRKFYQPDNAVLMVAGKFDTDKTLAMIEKTFGGLAKPGRQLEKTWTREQARDGVREVTVRRVTDQQMAAVLYPTAPGSHADAAALAALGDILGSAPNGRLHKQLVESKQAVGVGNIVFQLAEPGYSMYLSILSKDQSVDIAKKTLIDTVEGLGANPVTEAELKRAKTTLLNDLEKTINDPQRLCVSMSESIALGDWRLFFIQRDRIEALTLADINRVAKNYFKADNRSFGQFIPVATPDRAEIPDVPDVAKLVDGYKGRAKVAAGETFDATPANIDKRTEKLTLANGAKVALLSKKTRGETVSGRLSLHLGDETSLFGKMVASDLAADMLLRGSSKFTRAELDTKLGELKAKLNVSGSGQNVTISFDTVRTNLPALLDVLREVLRAPSFAPSEFDLLIKENLSTLESSRSEPQTAAAEAMKVKKNAPYKKGDIRYSSTIDEGIAEYSAAKLEAIKDFYKNFYGASAAEFSLVGDFDVATVKTKLANVIGDWNSPAKFTRAPSLPLTAASASVKLETPDKANAIYMAEMPFSLNDQAAEYPALLVADNVLGGGIKSRLFGRIRQKEGISYGVGSFMSIPALDKTANFGISAMFAPQNLERLQNAVKEELALFVKDGITATELADAKLALAQTYTLRRAQDPALAGALRNQLYLGRSMAFDADIDAKIAALTLDQVNAAIRQFIKPENIGHYYAGDFVGAAKKAAAAAATAK